MPSVLLFITGVLAGVIAGFILSRTFGRRRTGDASGEVRVLEEERLQAQKRLDEANEKLDEQRADLIL